MNIGDDGPEQTVAAVARHFFVSIRALRSGVPS
jgi:hypothetical protein